MRFILVMIIFFSQNLFAKDFNNGCGSGWNEPIVPEKIGLFCVNFASACAVHDNCYSKCLKDGENYNKPICKLSSIEQKEERRNYCDSDFLKEMNDGCSSCDIARKPFCKGVALLYKIAVKMAGKGSFDGKTIPDEYYAFLDSEAAKSFDFAGFEKEIIDVLSLPEIIESNRLDIMLINGSPEAKLFSLTPMKRDYKKIDNQFYLTDSLRYGKVDLSNAAKGKSIVEIKDLNIERLNTDKLQNIQTIQRTNSPIKQ